jgi:hypothetical protein
MHDLATAGAESGLRVAVAKDPVSLVCALLHKAVVIIAVWILQRQGFD